MPNQEVLIMAVTRMLSGVCIAGYIREPHPASHYRWVRPTKPFKTILLGDITDAAGRVMQCNDVVSLALERPCPDPPHGEDWSTDFVRQRPNVLRRLEGARRASFLEGAIDRAPEDVLLHERRSLCLIRPERVWATFALDSYSRKYRAHMGFNLPGAPHPEAASPRGVSVTDLKWRALGRAWLGELGSNPSLALDHTALLDRLGVQAIYLALGLSRPYKGRYWLMVIGVHTVPDYTADIDYDDL